MHCSFARHHLPRICIRVPQARDAFHRTSTASPTLIFAEPSRAVITRVSVETGFFSNDATADFATRDRGLS